MSTENGNGKDPVSSTATPPTSAVPKLDIRSAILGAKPKTKVVTFFGQEIEMRQPSMKTMLDTQSAGTTRDQQAAKAIIAYAFIPGTDQKVFNDMDAEALADLPWSEDMVTIQNAIAFLTGIDITSAIKNSVATSEG